MARTPPTTSRSRLPHTIGAIAIGLAAACSECEAADQPVAVHRGADVRVQLLRADSSVRGYYVTYESIPVGSGAGVPEPTVHRQVAAFAPDNFYHWSAKGNRSYPWEDDPLQQRLRLSGSRGVIEHPVDRSYSTVRMKPGDPLPGTAPSELLFFVLGWWPTRAIALPKTTIGAAVVFAQIARSEDYVVRPFQSFRNGHLCHVLESTSRGDSLWIDMDRGGALVAREIADPAGRRVRQVIEVTESGQVLPNVWAPLRFRNTVTDMNSRRKLTDAEMRVRHISVNQPPPPGMFDLQPRPGSIEGGSGGEFAQAVAGGLDHLDETARRAALFNRPGLRTDAGSTAWWLVLISNAVSILVIVGFARLRRRYPHKALPALPAGRREETASVATDK